MNKKTKQPAPKLEQSEIINLFCDAVSTTGQTAASNHKLVLFLGDKMYGRKMYPHAKAAQQAVNRLALGFLKSLKGKHPAATVSKVRRALKNNPVLRREAVKCAFHRELFHAAPPRRTEHGPA